MVESDTRHQSSPFLPQLTVKPRKSTVVQTYGAAGDDYQIVNTDTGEITEIGMVAKRQVERAEFIKFYTHDLGWLLHLKPAGVAVLRPIMSIAQEYVGKDHIPGMLTVFRQHGWTASSSYLHKGINNLIQAGLIARSNRIGWYWINPAYMFNGDRVKLYKEYSVKQMDLRPAALDVDPVED